MERRTVTHALAAKRLGVATRTIERMLRDGRLKAIPDRERLLVDAIDLELVLRDRRLLRKRRAVRVTTRGGVEMRTREAVPLVAAPTRLAVEATFGPPSGSDVARLSPSSTASSAPPAGITPLGAEVEAAPLQPFGRIRRRPSRIAAGLTLALACIVAIAVAMRVTDPPAKRATGRGASAAHVRTPALTTGIPISRGGPASAAVARGGAAESLPIEASPPSQAATSPAAIKPSKPGQSSAPRTSTSCFGGLTFGC